MCSEQLNLPSHVQLRSCSLITVSCCFIMLHHSVVLILLSVAVFAAADSAGKVHELLQRR